MHGVLDCRFGSFCTKYPTTMYGLCIPDFPWGDISYLSRFYGTDVRGHVQNDILFDILLHLEIKRD